MQPTSVAGLRPSAKVFFLDRVMFALSGGMEAGDGEGAFEGRRWFEGGGSKEVVCRRRRSGVKNEVVVGFEGRGGGIERKSWGGFSPSGPHIYISFR